jgi:predicted PurR-regulated permease PerM
VPDSLSEDDRRADRGLLARDRRRSADADGAEPDDPAPAADADADTETTTTAATADTNTADTDGSAPAANADTEPADHGGSEATVQAAGTDGSVPATDTQPVQHGGSDATPRTSDTDGSVPATDLESVESDGSEDGNAVGTPPGRAVSRRGKVKPQPDPVTDMAAREREAGVNEQNPFGRPGRPLTRSHPFVFGFYAALGVLAAYILLQALTNARQVIILIVVALFLAVGLNPGVEALERLGISRRWAVLLVFLALVGFFVGFGFAIVPPLSEQTTAIIHNLTSGNGYLEQLQNNPRLQDLDHRYHLLQKIRTSLQSKDLGTRAANGVVGVGQVVLSGVFSTLTVLILTLYFLTSLPSITGFMYRLAPRSRRARVALLGDEILARIGGYVAGNLLISLIAGVMSYIFLLIVGVPYALALALLVAITDLIPLVGATIGAVFVTGLSFFSGLWVGIATGIFFLVYQQVENYVIQPRVMKRSVDVQPAVTIIAALLGGALLGVIGALLAIPAAAAVALILREVVMPRQEQV